jgi:hypothetical protein
MQQMDIGQFTFDIKDCRQVRDTENVFVDRYGSIAKIEGGEVTHIYKTFKSNKGYMKTRLIMKDGTRKNVYVHRIVYDAFKGIPDGLIVHHRDTNKQNNQLDNLKIVDYAENILIEYREGRLKRKLNNKQVKNILRTHGELSPEVLAKKYNCSASLIRMIRKGERYKDVTI